MKWIKKGLIFKTENNFEWMVSHAALPVADRVNDKVLRIYFGTRDKEGRSISTYIDVEANNPQNIVHLNDKPILPLGKLGTFDDSGIMPSWIANQENKKYLYYIGWNPQVTVSYRLSIGLAISTDDGFSYEKYSEGPILDRSMEEPYFNTAPCVLMADDLWKMWYVSCTGWTVEKGQTEPLYLIRYAESQDGINWTKYNTNCLDYKFSKEAIGRPCVVKQGGLYKMWYCFRGSIDYRTNKEQSYRIGYAESNDGLKWTRKDDEAGIDRSEDGWDSEMMEYPYVYEHRGKTYMLYNGNGFGKSGFGYAVLDEDKD